MKKFLSLLLAMTLFLSIAACGNGDDNSDNGDNGDNGNNGDNGDNGDEVEYGDYKPGLHLGYTEGNENSYAYVYVDEEGYIQDIFIDSVYAKGDDGGSLEDEDGETYLGTTKMSMDDGCEYNMHDGEVEEDEDGDCYVEGEMMWWEQVEALADDIVEEQGIPSYDLDGGAFEDDDTISGVSITVDYLVDAVDNALEQAELGDDESPEDFDVPEFEGEGDYEPGIVFGASDYSDGNNSVAVGAVNEDGHLVHMAIDSVYFNEADDGTYENSEGNAGNLTTKMSLDYGCDYGMHGEPEYDDDGTCYVDGEMMWWEQVQAIADDVVDNQDVPNYDLDDSNYFDDNGDDTVSGVSITVNNYIEAIEDALE